MIGSNSQRAAGLIMVMSKGRPTFQLLRTFSSSSSSSASSSASVRNPPGPSTGVASSSAQQLSASGIEGSNRLVHIIADKRSSLSDLVRSRLPSGSDAEGLIRLGAVYRRRRADLSKAQGSYMTNDAERILMDVDISPGDYVRVHTSPRRYAASNSINWEAAVVYQDDDFVVVNKPSGLPAVPTGDNYLENVLFCMQNHLKVHKLYATHRLDADTSGLMLLGKTPEFAATFSALMRDGHVRKVYKALISASEQSALDGFEGSLVHYTPGESRPLPKLFLPSASEGSKRCETKITAITAPKKLSFDDCCSVLWPNTVPDGANASKLYQALEHYFKKNRSRHLAVPELVFLEAQLELVTGRTHQVRGQIQAYESPSAMRRGISLNETNHDADSAPAPARCLHVAGDNMYRGPSSHASPASKYMGSPFLALQVNLLTFCDQGI